VVRIVVVAATVSLTASACGFGITRQPTEITD